MVFKKKKIHLIFAGGTRIVHEEEIFAVQSAPDAAMWMRLMPELSLLTDIKTHFAAAEKTAKAHPNRTISAVFDIINALPEKEPVLVLCAMEHIPMLAALLSFNYAQTARNIVCTCTGITKNEVSNEPGIMLYKANLVTAVNLTGHSYQTAATILLHDIHTLGTRAEVTGRDLVTIITPYRSQASVTPVAKRLSVKLPFSISAPVNHKILFAKNVEYLGQNLTSLDASAVFSPFKAIVLKSREPINHEMIVKVAAKAPHTAVIVKTDNQQTQLLSDNAAVVGSIADIVLHAKAMTIGSQNAPVAARTAAMVMNVAHEYPE